MEKRSQFPISGQEIIIEHQIPDSPWPYYTQHGGMQPKELRTMSDLWFRILVLIHDLQNFAKDGAARARLEKVTDPFYISLPYFDTSEAIIIKGTQVDDSLLANNDNLDLGEILSSKSNLESVLEACFARLLKKRQASGTRDFRPCSAHDLAPLLCTLLGVNKEEVKDEKFRSRLARSGGNLDAVTNRLATPSPPRSPGKQAKGKKAKGIKGKK
jgi:hypothetical protein